MALAPSLSVFSHTSYLRFWIARVLIAGARQMEAVTIGWQVYDLARETRSIEASAFLLGLVGLVQFLPVLLLSLVGGQAADRLNRKYILITAQLVRIAGTFALIASVFLPTPVALPLIFSVAAMIGAVNAFTPAAASALYPTLVPRDILPSAIAWNSLGYQSAAIIGPAAGGLLLVFGEHVVYSCAAVMLSVAVVSLILMKTPEHKPNHAARGWSMVVEGLRYVGSNKIVQGAISLDLIVVFFAGSVALLPVFARDILHVGEQGLGLLRAAPAVGAAIVAYRLASRPLSRRVGIWMFAAVAVFGVAILMFGVSRVFWLSMFALVIHGAADMISVYVRQSLIQLATPDMMRGRVTSVSFIFISASNELGEFQSGVAARLLGPVGAVIMGGFVAIGAAGLWMRLFPQLAKADRFEDVGEQAIEAAAKPSPQR
ncbi:MAG: MFS transporter [Pseudomonadota bacterium]